MGKLKFTHFLQFIPITTHFTDKSIADTDQDLHLWYLSIKERSKILVHFALDFSNFEIQFLA